MSCLVVDVQNMAQIMKESDLAIGAAGTTTWERCCLGLPSILIVQAENQRVVAYNTEASGAAWTLENSPDVENQLASHLLCMRYEPNLLSKMSRAASDIIDGLGVNRVVGRLERNSG